MTQSDLQALARVQVALKLAKDNLMDLQDSPFAKDHLGFAGECSDLHHEIDSVLEGAYDLNAWGKA